MNSTMRRRCSGLAAAALGITLMAGCSAGTAPTTTVPTGGGESEAGQVSLTFNWWGGDSRAVLQQQVIDAFEAANPNIKITPEYANYDDFWTKLNTRAAANDLPDVFTVIDPFMYDYIDNGRLLDLSTQADVIDLKTVPASLFEMVTDGTAVYGTPAGVASFGVVIDPQAFADAGVPIPDDNTWTWDDLIDTAVAISKATPEVAGMAPPTDSQVASIFIRQQGEDWGNPDGSGEGLGFTVDTLAKYWDWAQRLQLSGGAQAADAVMEGVAAGGGIEQGALATHEAAMGIISANQLEGLEKAAGREFQFLMWPSESSSPKPGAWAKPGTFYSVNAKTAHPKEAAMFVDFITNSTEGAPIMGFDRGMQPNPKVVEAMSSSLTPAQQRFADYIARLTSKELQPFHRQNTGAGNLHGGAFNALNEEILFGTTTPQQAAQSLYDQLTAALS